MKLIRDWTSSRRAFLKASGLGAAMLPVLSFERAAKGATAPHRLLVIVSPNGWVHDTFIPKSATAAALSGLTLPDGTKPLEPHKADVNFIPGLEYRNYKAFYPSTVDYVDCHHSLPHLLNGKIGVMGKNSSSRPQDGASGYRPAGGGKSIDQWWADLQVQAGAKLAYPNLVLGIQNESCCEPTMVQASYRDADQPNSVENDPYRLNQRLFANLALNQVEIEKLNKERKSVLDYVGKNIDSFAKKLGTEDRQLVQQHLESVRRIESNLQSTLATGCQKPNVGAAMNITSNVNVPALINAQFDNVAAAMACDTTRAAVVSLANGGGGWFPEWLNNPDFNGGPLAGNAGNNRNHHDLAHASGSNAEAKRLKTILESWFMAQFAGLITRFKAIKEGSGTMLDNTIILWVNNMGTGDHSWRHNVWVTAGGKGMGFATGQYLPQGEWASRGLSGACVPQNGVLTAIANALAGANMTSFGDAQFGGQIPGLRA
ncbi:MAG: DUF1552 domain-containing protein [Deltaproteobacteria bacterium]|nr:DUF1552 domain-containing protein [Deltaproteobacteria bacterium]